MKIKMKIYLVEDCLNSPGRIYAAFAEKDAACDFRDHYHYDNAEVVVRTLLYEQQTSYDGYIE